MTRLTLYFWMLAATLAQAQQPATRILIAYHSDTGNTEKLAEAIRQGAVSVNGIEVTVRKVAQITDEEILKADGIIAGTPVQWGNLSTPTKQFLDRVGSVLWRAKRNGDGRTAGAFCTGGGVAMGKDTARVSILSAFLTMRFLVIGGVDSAGFGTTGPQATTGPTDPGISEAEREEARNFGVRFARLTHQIRSPAVPAEPSPRSEPPRP